MGPNYCPRTAPVFTAASDLWTLATPIETNFPASAASGDSAVCAQVTSCPTAVLGNQTVVVKWTRISWEVRSVKTKQSRSQIHRLMLRFVEQPTLFVSVLRAFANLTVAQRGCPALAKAPDHPALLNPPTPLADLPLQTKHARDYMHVRDTLSVTGWTFEVREIISRAHGIIGRGTVVVRAKVTHCPKFKGLVGEDVAVKWSWISRSRLPETKFVDAAVNCAVKTDRAMLDHLPKIYHSEDLEWLAPLSQAFLMGRFENDYEDRVLRVIVQELLKPIVELEAEELALAFKGIVKCHRWLFETVNILQRDVSVDNLMFRRSEDGTVYGVLNDYDLAEFYKSEPQPPSSKQRTGTKPYMAIDLLVRDPPKHEYRHDLESFLYVLVFLTCETGRSDLDTWNDLGMDGLRKDKELAIQHGFPPNFSEFAIFAGWVWRLSSMFHAGLIARNTQQDFFLSEEDPFDDLTLGGKVSGAKFEDILDLRNLQTEEELVEERNAKLKRKIRKRTDSELDRMLGPVI